MNCNKCGAPFIRRAKEVRFIDWCDGCNGKWFSMSEGCPDGAEFVNVSDIFFQKEYKKVRHNVCEKIRNYIDKQIEDRFPDNDVDYLTIDLEDFEDLLDQIEQGEE